MKIIIPILFLFFSSSTISSDFRYDLNTLDSYIEQSRFKSASKKLLSMMDTWGSDNSQIIERAERLNKIAEIQSSFNSDYSIELPSHIKNKRSINDFYRKFSNPSNADVAMSFLATATFFLGVAYVSNWVDAQENPSNSTFTDEENILSVKAKDGRWISNTLNDFKVRLFKNYNNGDYDFIKEASKSNGLFSSNYVAFYGLSSGNYTIEIKGELNGRNYNLGSSDFNYSGGRVTCISEAEERKLNCYRN